MVNRNFEMWAIQNNPYQLNDALEKIRDTNDSTLVTNCISRIKIGDKKLHTVFDTAIYNEKKNITIFLMQYGDIDIKELETILQKKNITYNEIKLRPYKAYKPRREQKDIFFATDMKSFTRPIRDSIMQGDTSCKYYPEACGRFSIKYFISKSLSELFDDYYIRGVVEFNDKLILIVNIKQPYNMYKRKIIKTLNELKIDTTIDPSPTIIQESCINGIKKMKKK